MITNTENEILVEDFQGRWEQVSVTKANIIKLGIDVHARLSPWVRKDPTQRLGVLAPLQRSRIDQLALLGKPDVRIAGWDAEEKACAFNEEEACQNKVNIP